MPLAKIRGVCHGLLDRLLEKSYRHPANYRLAQHLQHERLYLFTFLNCPGLDATNHEAERAIRWMVIARKGNGGRRTPAATSFAVSGEFDASDLSQVGWGIVFATEANPAIKDGPLIDRRREQTGAGPFVLYEGAEGCHPGETALQWLTRHQVRLDVVNSDKGMPYYLTIVGSPESIPFEFQNLLDLYWGVGRLWFDTAAEFRQYAESAVASETAQTAPTSRQIALFATEHDFDAATQLFTRCVAKPLSEGEGARPVPIGQWQKFGLRQFLGDNANKHNLREIYLGANPSGTPALLFSGSHGIEFDAGDPRQADSQDALVCADWVGFGKITEEDWFGASDVPSNARLHGMIHFLFACYDGGCPKADNFDRLNKSPKRIAALPFLARLPRALPTHPNGGALACLSHVERAWAYSFQSDKGGSQSQGFRDVIGRLLRGERMGQATDSFNIRWAALSTELAEAQNDLRFGADLSLKKLGQLWVARDDARNFLVIGDPAVRLRVEDMPQLSS